MRAAGRAGRHPGLGSRSHFCWVYDDPADYRARLVEFFDAGLRGGLRVAYAGWGGVGAVRADLAGLPDLDQLLAGDALQILAIEDVYGVSGPVDPARVIARYAAATEQALADGFRGLRVSGDVTELVRTPQQREAFVRYEFLVGRYMARHPLSAMCACAAELGRDAVSELASLHALGQPGCAPFQVFACPDGALGLGGELDGYGAATFERVLAHVRPGADTGPLTVDMAEVRFVDHRALLALDDYARANRMTMILRSAPPIVARLIEWLPASRLQLAEAGIPL